MKLDALLLLALAILSQFHCSKEADEDETPAADNSTTLSLPGKLSVGCGDTATTNCFPKSSSLTLAGESPLQAMRSFAWIILGYPSNATNEYNATFTNDTIKNIMPMDGLVSRIEGARSSIIASVKAHYKKDAKIKTCSDLPTSGTFPLSSNSQVTATWIVPTMKAPFDSPNSKGGLTYSKGISLLVSEHGYLNSYRLEFFCDYNGMAMTIETSLNGAIKQKSHFFYDGSKANQLYADFYFLDKGIVGSSNDIHLLLQMRQTSKNVFKSWVTRTGPNGSGNAMGYRYAVHADNGSSKISFYTVEHGTGTTIPVDTWLAHSYVTGTSISDGAAPATSDGSDPKNGCASSWDQAGTAMTSSDLCSGLSLSTPPAPFWNSSANLSMAELYNNFHSQVLGL